MKKLYSLIVAAVLFTSASYAQCTINAGAQTTPGVNPGPDQLPCIVRTIAYDQTLQGKVQDTWDTVIFGENIHVIVDSVRIDSIAGLPNGITWSKNPDLLLGGGNGCVRFTGTTTDSVGRYDLTAFGTAWLHIQGSGLITIDTTRQVSGDLNRYSPFGGYYVDVINQGGACHQLQGINDFSAELNSAFSVYPNPSTGVFEFRLNAGNRVNGEIEAIDATGRVVYSQKLDVVGLYNTNIDLTNFSKGLYTIRLKTTEGFATKHISIN